MKPAHQAHSNLSIQRCAAAVLEACSVSLTLLKSENESFTAHDVNARAGFPFTRYGACPGQGLQRVTRCMAYNMETQLSHSVHEYTGGCAHAATVCTAK